jgi:hypothetical protein
LSEEKRVYYQQEIYKYIGCFLDGDLVYLEIELEFRAFVMEVAKFNRKYKIATEHCPKITRKDLHSIISAVGKATNRRQMGWYHFQQCCPRGFRDLFSSYPAWWDCISKDDIDSILDCVGSLAYSVSFCFEYDDNDQRDDEMFNALLFDLIQEGIINKAESVVPTFAKFNVPLPDDYAFPVVQKEMRELFNPVLIKDTDSQLYTSEQVVEHLHNLYNDE